MGKPRERDTGTARNRIIWHNFPVKRSIFDKKQKLFQKTLTWHGICYDY